MPMVVMHIRHMRVRVPQRRMLMEMSVRFAGRIEWTVDMTMVLVVHMRMSMSHQLVNVLMFMTFTEMQPHPNRH